MEERKTIFDYLAEVLIVFGITVIILNILCQILGGAAKGYSSIFRLGSNGIARSTIFEFLAMSFLVTGSRYLFFSDFLFKKLSATLRTLCMVTLVIVLCGIFSYIFSWFPINDWLAWTMFFLSFAACFIISLFVTLLQKKLQDRALQKALEKIQEEHHGK